jgi:hypothetical protein
VKWILLGAVLAVLLLYPSALTVVAAVVAWLLANPVLLAFAAGLALRPHLPKPRRWAR